MLKRNNSSTSMERSDCVVGGGKKGMVDGGGGVDLELLLKMSGIFSVLLGDIFLDIMSRVPLKSLSQCRWVCKSWYKLITSTIFAKIQFQWAIKNNSPWVLFWNSTNNLYLVDDQEFDLCQTSVTAHNLDLKDFEGVGESFGQAFEIVGYVNGLLCFNTTKPDLSFPSPFYICNPITLDYITIQKPPNYTFQIAAFGFDPTTDEYKVICFSQSVNKNKDYIVECLVYTLGSSQWRKIEDVPCNDITRYGALLNGNLHWISFDSDSEAIIAFNVGVEKFNVIELPPEMLQNGCSFKSLMVLEEHLCVFIHKISYGKPSEIWVMEDYGVQCSWVKKYSLYSPLRSGFTFGSNNLIKLRNGEVLVQFDISDEFMAYFNPEKGTIRPIRVIKPSANQLFLSYRSVVQAGSLFSPKTIGKSREVKIELNKLGRDFSLLKKKR